MNQKLMILGGTYQHRKLVRKAESRGITTFVADYYEEDRAIAKKLSDYSVMRDVYDLEYLSEYCRSNNINAVAGAYLDPVQLPYFNLCTALELPCFGNEEQYRILTNKAYFKRYCADHGVDVIKSYESADTVRTKDLPVIVKPTDGRGSKGQTICYSLQDLAEAVKLAVSNSRDGTYIVERYLQNVFDTQLAYIVQDDKPILYRLGDRYLGDASDGMDRVVFMEICPSERISREKNPGFDKVEKMIRNLKLGDAPVFLQCLADDKNLFPYDPGLRLPGDDYDDAFEILTGIDVAVEIVDFAFHNCFSKEFTDRLKGAMDEGAIAILTPALKPGCVGRVEGLDEVKALSCVASYAFFYGPGDHVPQTGDINQRFCEIVLYAKTHEQLREEIRSIYHKLRVFDDKGDNQLLVGENVKKYMD